MFYVGPVAQRFVRNAALYLNDLTELITINKLEFILYLL